jgi:hypothetical protein
MRMARDIRIYEDTALRKQRLSTGRAKCSAGALEI